MSTFSDRLRYHTATLDRPLFCEAADKIDEAAAFLDRMATRIALMAICDEHDAKERAKNAADCRAMAKKLRGEAPSRNPYGEGDPAEIDGT